MNNPKRFAVKPATLPDGHYAAGIADEEIGASVGYVLTIRPHVEERMIDLFQFLAGIEHEEDARIVFRSIQAQRSRIDLMIKTLTRSPHNASLPSGPDQAIEEYRSINTIRNEYAHGLWWHSRDTGNTYIEPKLDNSGMIFIQGREVTVDEVKRLLDRMTKLVQRLKEPDLYKR